MTFSVQRGSLPADSLLMRKASIVLLFVFTVMLAGCFTPPPQDSGQTLPWFENAMGYDRAQNARSGGPMLLYFHAPWCPHCKKFERNILENPQVKTALEAAVKVRIDTPKNLQLAEDYGIQDFPRVYVEKGRFGKVIEIPTHEGPEVFLEKCREAGLIS